jgi:hypothetical protein
VRHLQIYLQKDGSFHFENGQGIGRLVLEVYNSSGLFPG